MSILRLLKKGVFISLNLILFVNVISLSGPVQQQLTTFPMDQNALSSDVRPKPNVTQFQQQLSAEDERQAQFKAEKEHIAAILKAETESTQRQIDALQSKKMNGSEVEIGDLNANSPELDQDDTVETTTTTDIWKNTQEEIDLLKKQRELEKEQKQLELDQLAYQRYTAAHSPNPTLDAEIETIGSLIAELDELGIENSHESQVDSSPVSRTGSLADGTDESAVSTSAPAATELKRAVVRQEQTTPPSEVTARSEAIKIDSKPVVNAQSFLIPTEVPAAAQRAEPKSTQEQTRLMKDIAAAQRKEIEAEKAIVSKTELPTAGTMTVNSEAVINVSKPIIPLTPPSTTMLVPSPEPSVVAPERPSAAPKATQDQGTQTAPEPEDDGDGSSDGSSDSDGEQSSVASDREDDLDGDEITEDHIAELLLNLVEQTITSLESQGVEEEDGRVKIISEDILDEIATAKNIGNNKAAFDLYMQALQAFLESDHTIAKELSSDKFKNKTSQRLLDIQRNLNRINIDDLTQKALNNYASMDTAANTLLAFELIKFANKTAGQPLLSDGLMTKALDGIDQGEALAKIISRIITSDEQLFELLSDASSHQAMLDVLKERNEELQGIDNARLLTILGALQLADTEEADQIRLEREKTIAEKKDLMDAQARDRKIKRDKDKLQNLLISYKKELNILDRCIQLLKMHKNKYDELKLNNIGSLFNDSAQSNNTASPELNELAQVIRTTLTKTKNVYKKIEDIKNKFSILLLSLNSKIENLTPYRSQFTYLEESDQILQEQIKQFDVFSSTMPKTEDDESVIDNEPVIDLDEYDAELSYRQLLQDSYDDHQSWKDNEAYNPVK